MDTKKLRQKILDLAIHGKLVPQNPNDEPASVLLERIRAETERLIAEGKIKRSKKSATSDTSHYENVPFEVPEGWCWTTIGEVSSSILYGVSESAKETGAYKLLRITDIQDNKVDWDSVPYTDFNKDKALNYLLQDGDILFARTGATVGKSYLVSGLTKDSIYASYLIRVQTSQLIFPEYIKRFFESGYYWEQISLSSVGIGQPNVNGTTLANLNVPIPPYKEQLRIVEEANRWLAIADILDENTGHICKAIESAKAKILDLAIHGKLVPQDPNDEPAIELLKRINPKAVASCDNPHYVGDIPSNWVWTTLGSIGKWQSGGTPSKMHKEYYGGNIPWLKTGDLNDGLVTDIPEHITELGLENSSAKLNPAGSVLIAMYGATIGKVGILGIPATTNQACCACIEYKGITQQHLFLFLLANKANFVAAGGGGAQPNISKEIITKTLIPLPPIEEQNRIVAKVKDLFSHLDMIEKSLQA